MQTASRIRALLNGITLMLARITRDNSHRLSRSLPMLMVVQHLFTRSSIRRDAESCMRDPAVCILMDLGVAGCQTRRRPPAGAWLAVVLELRTATDQGLA